MEKTTLLLFDQLWKVANVGQEANKYLSVYVLWSPTSCTKLDSIVIAVYIFFICFNQNYIDCSLFRCLNSAWCTATNKRQKPPVLTSPTAPAMFSWWEQSNHLCIKRRGNIFESGRHRFSLWRMHPTLWELLSEERSGNRTWKCKITLCQVLGSTYFYFWQNLHQISNLSNKYQIEDTKYKISRYKISIIKFQI